MRRLVGNLLLSLAVSLLLLGALEGVSRLLERRTPRPQRAEYLWDWQVQWEDDFYTLASDETGWPPGAEFNGDGLRDRTHAPEKPQGVWRVVFLGDSVTLGDGNQPDEAYPQVLQARLDEAGRPVEVFNVALWGWSTRQQSIAYRRIARRYSPDQVVLAVCLNDIPEMQNNLSKPPPLLAELHRRSALVRLLVGAERREVASVEELFESPRLPKVESAFALFFEEVRRLRAIATADGARFAVLVLPFRFQLAPQARPPLVQERIQDFCRAEDIACFDALPDMRRVGPSLFNDYDHLSPAGGRFVAGWLLEQPLLPSQGSAPALLSERLGPPPWGIAALRSALTASDSGLRRAAAWALGRAGKEASAALPELRAALADRDEPVRAAVARALGEIGLAAGGARAGLLEALGDPRQSVRWAAADALHRVGVGAPEAPALAARLDSSDAYVRAFATFELGVMGEAAGEAAVPALVEALKRDGGAGRSGAAAALARLGPAASGAVPALREELRHPDPARRWRAARALGRIGAAAAPAVTDLVARLGDDEPSVRVQAARALGRIGEAARPAIPALVAALEDPDPDLKQEALAALGKIPGR